MLNPRRSFYIFHSIAKYHSAGLVISAKNSFSPDATAAPSPTIGLRRCEPQIADHHPVFITEASQSIHPVTTRPDRGHLPQTHDIQPVQFASVDEHPRIPM